MPSDYSLTASPGSALPVAVKADGLRIWDRDGREYLDACGGAMVTTLGHRHPRLVQAAKRQLDAVSFTYRFSFGNEAMLELAELLHEVGPMPGAWSFFNSSGSESIESAIHLALLYWQYRGRPEKTELIARFPSFHGSTLGALGLSGSKWRSAFDHVLAGNAVAEAPLADIRARRSPEEACAHGVEELRRAIEQRGAGRVAAVFLEPITGASAAAVVPPAGYLSAVRQLCDEYDVLLIADETITGFGRTGRWWATQLWDVTPDVTTFAKGVTSGITPFSGLTVAPHVAQVLTDGGGFPYGHTFSGHPVGCAVAAEAVRVIRDERLVDRAAVAGARLQRSVREAADTSPVVGDVRGAGLLLGVELVRDRESLTPLPGASARLQRLALDRDLLVYACATPMRDHVIEAVLLAPPLVIDDADLADVTERFCDALGALAAEAAT